MKNSSYKESQTDTQEAKYKHICEDVLTEPALKLLRHTWCYTYWYCSINDVENNRGNKIFSIRLSFLIEHNLAEFCFFALQNSVPNVHFCVNPAAYSCIHEGNALLVLSTNAEALKSPNNAALTNLNCSLTHWNSTQSSSELLISRQNLLPNLPFLEHLSGHRQRFPLSFQQYLEKINIALFVCFILSSTTENQPTFPPSDQKRNNLPRKFTNQTTLLPHILLGSTTRCVRTSAVGAMNKAQEDIKCRSSCKHTTYNSLFNHLFWGDKTSTLCLILPVALTASNSACK